MHAIEQVFDQTRGTPPSGVGVRSADPPRTSRTPSSRIPKAKTPLRVPSTPRPEPCFRPNPPTPYPFPVQRVHRGTVNRTARQSVRAPERQRRQGGRAVPGVDCVVDAATGTGPARPARTTDRRHPGNFRGPPYAEREGGRSAPPKGPHLRRIFLLLAAVAAAVGVTAGPAVATTGVPSIVNTTYFTASQPANGYEGVGQYIKTTNSATNYQYIVQASIGQDVPFFGFWEIGGVRYAIMAASVNTCSAATGSTCSGGWLYRPYSFQPGSTYFLYVVRSASSAGTWEYWVLDVGANVWTPVGGFTYNNTLGVAKSVKVSSSWGANYLAACSQYPTAGALYYPTSFYTVAWGASITAPSSLNSVQPGDCNWTTSTAYSPWIWHKLGV